MAHHILKAVQLEHTCLSPGNPNASPVWKDIIVRQIRPTINPTLVLKVISVQTAHDSIQKIRAPAEHSVTKHTDSNLVIVSLAYLDNIVQILVWRNRPVRVHLVSIVCVDQRVECRWSTITSLPEIVYAQPIPLVCIVFEY